MNEKQTEVAETIQGVVGDTVKLLSTITEVLTTELPEDVIAVFGHLHPESLNVFQFLVQTIESGSNWVEVERLVPILGYVNRVADSDVISLIGALNDASLVLHIIANQLRDIFLRSPSIAHAAGEAIVAGDIHNDQGIRVWAWAFVAGQPLEAIKYATTIVKQEPSGNLASTHLLQALPAADVNVSAHLVENAHILFEGILELANSGPHEVIVCQSTCKLVSYFDEAFKYVSERLETGTTLERQAIADWLATLRQAEVGPSRNSTRGMIQRLVFLCVDDVQLRQQAQRALLAYIGEPGLMEIGVDALLQTAHKGANVDITKIFTFAKILYSFSEAALNRLITYWALLDEYSPRPLESLLESCVSAGRSIGIDEVTFNGADNDRKARAIRRIVSLSPNGALLCSLVRSLAETEALRPDGFQLGIQVLNFVVREYPLATESFLRARVAAVGRTGDTSRLYRNSLANHLHWRRVLSNLPVAKELIPKESQRFTLQIANSRINRQIIEAARSMSVFASVAKKIHVKQGLTVASHTNSGQPHMTQMTHHAGALELPSSETTDPIGRALQRARNLK